MKDKLYTANALQANRVAAMFRAALSKTKVGDLAVDISEPEETTGKGVLALQHITLKSPNGLSFVVGQVNAITRVAELRPFGTVVRLHEDRFKLPPSFDGATYDAFLEQCTTVLKDQGLSVSVVADEVEAVSPGKLARPDESTGGAPRSNPTVAIVVVVVGALIGAVIMWLAR